MNNTKHLAIISSTLIIISLILGSSFKNAFEHLNTIKTTGSAKKDFVADIIIWDGSFSTKNMVLEDSHKLVLQKFQVQDELKDIEIKNFEVQWWMAPRNRRCGMRFE